MTKDGLTLIRRRYIPDETIHLRDDRVLRLSGDYLLTCWNAIKPRSDFLCGFSVYYFDEGVKISKLFDKGNNLVYYYCDIVEYIFDEEKNQIIVNDLLADVIVYPDGSSKVLDVGEIADALELGLIDEEAAKMALKRLDWLLSRIYYNKFAVLCGPIDEAAERILAKPKKT